MKDPPRRPLDRRALGWALTRATNASVADVLRTSGEGNIRARVIGITGAPGSGKSTLVAKLATRRLERGATLAVIAIDPTSPKSHGSVLGDRIRMEALAEDPRVYIRSLPSRQGHGGLNDNMIEVLATLDRFGFEEVIIETVGVGQTEYGIRSLADVEILVLTPGSGDHIQMMKAGIIETADLFVINKSDLSGADRTEAELLGVLQSRSGGLPPVIRANRDDDAATAAISDAIDAQLAKSTGTRNGEQTVRMRRYFLVQALIERRLAECLAVLPADAWDSPLGELYQRVVDGLRVEIPAHTSGAATHATE